MNTDQKYDMQSLVNEAEERSRRLEQLMPTEEDAMKVIWVAVQRLKDLGWKDAIYCPKDMGHKSQFWECGCIGSAPGFYFGEWPNGTWFLEDAGDAWPSRPTLFRPMRESDIEPSALL